MEVDHSHEVPSVIAASVPQVESETHYAVHAESPPNVDAFCMHHRTDYQEICDGIGPLHIPMPPHLRLSPHGNFTQRSRYKSLEAWLAALTPAQRKYYDQECMSDEPFATSDLCGENTPLVLVFSGDHVTPDSPWLTNAAGELFGNTTPMANGHLAPNGFIALADLDDNHDGVIDKRDKRFGELRPTSVVSIRLDAHMEVYCIDHMCEGERASFVWRDEAGLHDGTVIDVYGPRLY